MVRNISRCTVTSLVPVMIYIVVHFTVKKYSIFPDCMSHELYIRVLLALCLSFVK